MDSPQKKRQSPLSPRFKSKCPKLANVSKKGRTGQLFLSFPQEIEASILSFLDTADFCNARATSRLWKLVCGQAMEKSVLDQLKKAHVFCHRNEYVESNLVCVIRSSWPNSMDTKDHLMEEAWDAARIRPWRVPLNGKVRAMNLLRQRAWVTDNDFEEVDFIDDEGGSYWNIRIGFHDKMTPQKAVANFVRLVTKYEDDIRNAGSEFNLPLFKQFVVGLLTNAESTPMTNAKYEYTDRLTGVDDYYGRGERDAILFKASSGRPVSISFKYDYKYWFY